jgi:hypothetical protein
MTNLAPVPSESSTCPNCSAPLVADQRYCLSCGQPTSPVRLAFLDVLETERQPQQLNPGAMGTAPVPYGPYIEPVAGPAWLRRYAPLFGVLSVLLLAMIVGLLVGHWVTQSKPTTSGPQVIKVEGLGALGASSTTPTSTTSTTAASGSSGTSAKSEEEKEEAEAKKEEKEKTPAKAPEAKKVSGSTITKLEKSTGKTHEKELSKLSTAPIEVK